MARSVRVVAAVIRQGGCVLAQQRLPGGPRGLLWEFPGGKIEPGETPEEALVRECREELAITVEVGPRLMTHSHAYADLEVHLEFFACRVLDGEPRPLHAHALRFEPISGLTRLAFCEADRPFLEWLVNCR